MLATVRHSPPSHQDANVRGPILGLKQSNISAKPKTGKLQVFSCQDSRKSNPPAPKQFALNHAEIENAQAPVSNRVKLSTGYCSSPATTLGLSTPPHKLGVFHDNGVLANAAAIVNARVRLLADKENMAPFGSPVAPRNSRSQNEQRRPLSILSVKKEIITEDKDEEEDNNDGRYVYLNVSSHRHDLQV